MSCAEQNIFVHHHFHSRQVKGHESLEVASDKTAIDEAVIEVDTVVSAPSHCNQFKRHTVNATVAQVLKMFAHGDIVRWRHTVICVVTVAKNDDIT